MIEAGLAIEVAVKGVVVLAAACTMYLLMRRNAASQRHLVLAVAMVGVLMIPFFSIVLPSVTMPIRATAIETVSPVKVTPSTITSPRPPRAVEPIAGASQIIAPKTVITKPAPVADSSFSWMGVITLVWTAGFAATLFPFFIGLMGIRAVKQSGRALTDPEWSGALRAARVGLGVSKHVMLIESSRARVPMTWGIFRSVIALPVSAQDWSPSRRQVVLCHELAHIKRRDFLTQSIARAACAAHWFNPLSWWALRAMSLERERACDDLVVESGVRAPDYADHLLQIARDMKGASLTARTAIAMAGHSRLEQRVRALLDATQNRRALGVGGRIATAGAALACVALVAMLQPTAVAEEAGSDEDTKVVIRISDDENEKHKEKKRVRRHDRDHSESHVIRDEHIEILHSEDGDYDLSAIFEHVSEVLEEVDLDVIIEKALEREDVHRHIERTIEHIGDVDLQVHIQRALEQENVQEHIEHALEQIDDVDLQVHIQRALEEENVQEHIEHALEQINEVDLQVHIQRALEEVNVQEHIEHALEQLEEVDFQEHIQRALEQENVQEHIELVIEQLEDIDIEEHILLELEALESINLSPVVLDELESMDRREVKREVRKAKRALRNADIDEHVNEALRHLEEIDIDAHIDVALGHLSELQDSPEWREGMESMHEALGAIDFNEIGDTVIETLEDLDIAPIIEAALQKVDEIDVDAIVDILDENSEIMVDSPSRVAPSVDGSNIEVLIEQDDLRRANLRQAKLRGLDLSGKNLRGARLAGADLRGANLEGADLRDTDLSGANLREANLKNARLGGALLDAANLRKANLRGVILRDVDLSQADTRGAKYGG
jgi:beta-lactamase regulating signal transducer with metallopeptidase domain